MPARTASLVFLALALVPCAREARALGLVADDRFNRYENRYSPFEPPQSGTFLPDSFFGPFPEQQSTIDFTADGLGFDGRAVGDSGGYFDYSGVITLYAWNEMSFSLTFRLDGEGTIGASGLLQGDSEGGSARFSVSDAGGTLYEASSYYMDGNYHPFAFDATVGPGTYTIFAFTGDHLDDAQGHFDFSFSVRDKVPEPATAVLLATGLAILQRRRR